MERYNSAKWVGIIGIIGNLFLLIIKIIVAVFTHSQAMLGDTLNSAGDIASSIMTFIGNKISSKEADEEHNFGHGKAEYIFSLLISVLMLILAFELLSSSTKSFFRVGNYTFSWYLIIVCILTIITKFSLYMYTRKIARIHNNLLVEANAKDHLNDCLLTSLNLIAAFFGMIGITYVDSIVGLLVSFWIFFVGISLFKDSYDVLMDKGVDTKTRDKIMSIVAKYPEIKKTNHFNSVPVGYLYHISLTIFVDGNLSTYESHEIANRLEKEITKLDEVYLTIIHVNPHVPNERKTKR